MGLGVIGPQGVTVITPPSRERQTKVGQLVAGDGSTGFAAFGLPMNAFIAGVSFISAGANTTQTVNVGFTSGGVELASSYAPNSTGYATSGSATGASVGTTLTADKTVYLKASATLTNTVTVLVDYWVVPVGQGY